MVTIPRPANPFVNPLFSPVQMAQQQGTIGSPMVPMPAMPQRMPMRQAPPPAPPISPPSPPAQVNPLTALGGGLNALGGDPGLAFAAGVLGGGSTSEALGRGFGNVLAQRQAQNGVAGSAPSNVREWQYFNKLTPEQQSQYLRMKRANPYLDTGTGYVMPDPTNPGQTVGGPIQKDLAGAEADKARGKGQGEAEVAYKSMSSKMPGLKQVVSGLDKLAETARYTFAGQVYDEIRKQTGQEPTQEAVDRATYIAMVDNQILPLLRDTFGAQFTVREGDTLRATLGDPNKTPAEKKAVLQAFIDQKERDVKALAEQAGVAPAGQQPGTVIDYTDFFK